MTSNNGKADNRHEGTPYAKLDSKKVTLSAPLNPNNNKKNTSGKKSRGHVTQSRDVTTTNPETDMEIVEEGEENPFQAKVLTTNTSPTIASMDTAEDETKLGSSNSTNNNNKYSTTSNNTATLQEVAQEINNNDNSTFVFNQSSEQAEEQPWKIIEGKRRHFFYLASEDIEGVTLPEKKKLTEKIFRQIRGFIGVNIKKTKETVYLKVEVATEDAKTKCLETAEKSDLAILNSLPTTKSSDGEDTKHVQANEHLTISVRDIPLDYNKEDIAATFSAYGDIESIKTFAHAGWLTARITFTEAETMEAFKDEWSTIIRKDSVRITPVEDYQRTFAEREAFQMKLCNLPPGTTALELEEYIKSVGGKTCFIPRNKTTYKRLRYAFVNFEDDETIDNLMYSFQDVILRKHKIFWTAATTKICHRCHSTEHLVMNCPNAREQLQEEKRLETLAALYQKKEVQADNLSTFNKKIENLRRRKEKTREKTTARETSNNSNNNYQGKPTYASTARQNLTSNQDPSDNQVIIDLTTRINKLEKSANINNSNIADRLTKLEETVDDVLLLLREIVEKGEEEEARAAMEIELNNKPIPQTPSQNRLSASSTQPTSPNLSNLLRKSLQKTLHKQPHPKP